MKQFLIGLILGLAGVVVAQVDWGDGVEFVCSVHGCDPETCELRYPTQTTKWLGSPLLLVNVDKHGDYVVMSDKSKWPVDPFGYQVGLRSDGVVVWKRVEVVNEED